MEKYFSEMVIVMRKKQPMVEERQIIRCINSWVYDDNELLDLSAQE